MSRATEQNERKDHALVRLRELCPVGSTIYTCNESVARSGMSASVKLYTVDADGAIVWLSGYVDALGAFRMRAGNNGVTVHGCGLDRGFEVVYYLGRLLHADGYALKHRWI